jgi:hypothetical protein
MQRCVWSFNQEAVHGEQLAARKGGSSARQPIVERFIASDAEWIVFYHLGAYHVWAALQPRTAVGAHLQGL